MAGKADEKSEMVDDSGAPGAVRIAGYRMPLPRSRLLRIAIGVLLIIGGLFSILPVFGVWMIPLGLLVLSVDIPRVRRWRRRFAVWFHRRYPKLAAKLNPGGPSSGEGNGGTGRNGAGRA
jgi:hypothetical protein